MNQSARSMTYGATAYEHATGYGCAVQPCKLPVRRALEALTAWPILALLMW
jgi:hypothetical protein